VAPLGAGVNLPYLAIKLALGEEVEVPDIEWETEMVRFWEELIVGPTGPRLLQSELVPGSPSAVGSRLPGGSAPTRLA
jgi:hypothetical protein